MKEKIFKYPGYNLFYIFGGISLLVNLRLLVFHLTNYSFEELVVSSLLFVLASITFIISGVWWIHKKEGAPGSLLIGFAIAVVTAVAFFLVSFSVYDHFYSDSIPPYLQEELDRLESNNY